MSRLVIVAALVQPQLQFEELVRKFGTQQVLRLTCRKNCKFAITTVADEVESLEVVMLVVRRTLKRGLQQVALPSENQISAVTPIYEPNTSDAVNRSSCGTCSTKSLP